MSTAGPAVGVVVINYNGGERILRVLDALQRQHHALAEIIVVDNRSTDGSPDQIRAGFAGVRVLALEDNVGLSVARNRGLGALGTPLALLLDHDVYVDEHCIGLMVSAFVAHRPTVVCPRIRLVPERDIVQVEGAAPHFVGTLALRHGFAPIRTLSTSAGEVGGCIGACMLLDREAAIAAGGFEELFFFYNEDLEFSLRLRALGHRFWCDPAAEVYHERSAGTPGLSFRGHEEYPQRRAYMTMRNRLVTMLIHYRLRTLLLLLPVLVVYELASFVAIAKKGRAAAWFQAWGWLLCHPAMIAARRRRMQSLRRVDDRVLLIGGPLPLAPGFVTGRFEAWLVHALSYAMNSYWAVARRWVG